MSRKDGIAILVCLVWPFLFLLPYVVPFGHSYAGIGNDFNPLYVQYKLFWLMARAADHVPLWSPSEACGYPFYPNPFPAVLYPLNLVLLAMYRLLGGYSMLDHQRFTILGISIFTCGLYAWLRMGLRFDRRASLLSALVIGCSYRMTELLRFPNAIHVAAWYPWALLALHGILPAKTLRRAGPWMVMLGIALYNMTTAGYPYLTYYAIFLLIPYGLLFANARWRTAVLGPGPAATRLGIGTAAGVIAITMAVLLRYLLDLVHVMNGTTSRMGGDWLFSTHYKFLPIDTLGSFLYPPASNLEGIFYIGAIGSLLIWTFLVRPTKDRRWSEGVLLSWIAAISMISYGSISPLFRLLWHVVPGFNRLRVWGRISVILLPLLALLLAKAFSEWEAVMGAPKGQLDRARWRARLLYGLGGALALQGLFILLHPLDPYWRDYFIPRMAIHVLHVSVANTVRGYQAYYAVTFVLAALCLVFVSTTRGARYAFWVILGFSMLDLGAVGPWLWYGGPHPTHDRQAPNFYDMMEGSFIYPRDNPLAAPTLSPRFSVQLMPDQHFQRYRDFLEATKDDPSAQRALLGEDKAAQRLFLTDALHDGSVRDFLRDAAHFPGRGNVLFYDGDTLKIRLQLRRQGFFSFIDNWDEGWHAQIDGQLAPIERPFGTFKAVRVPAGDHIVIFHYRPYP